MLGSDVVILEALVRWKCFESAVSHVHLATLRLLLLVDASTSDECNRSSPCILLEFKSFVSLFGLHVWLSRISLLGLSVLLPFESFAHLTSCFTYHGVLSHCLLLQQCVQNAMVLVRILLLADWVERSFILEIAQWPSIRSFSSFLMQLRLMFFIILHFELKQHATWIIAGCVRKESNRKRK